MNRDSEFYKEERTRLIRKVALLLKYVELGGINIRKFKIIPSHYSGIYQEMVQILGVDTVSNIHKYYKGQQITFPIRLYSKEYVLKRLSEYDGTNLRQLSRELEYSERWLRHLIATMKKNDDS